MKSYGDCVNRLVCIKVCRTVLTTTVMCLSRAGVCVVSYCPQTDQNEIAGQFVVKVSSVEQGETDRQTTCPKVFFTTCNKDKN